MTRPRPFVLAIIDGWGVRADAGSGNAITLANPQHMTAWAATFPYVPVAAAGLAVGLPDGQMGNSEVGHLNIGAGFVIYQDSTRISEAILDGTFFENAALLAACAHANANGSKLHLMGLLGIGGVHAYSDHLFALLRLARQQGVREVFIHPFLDGRDTPPQSATPFMEALQAVLAELGIGTVATVNTAVLSSVRQKTSSSRSRR